ncbi:MAG: Gfo/Idh/MocA family oxidoreductase [Planctomycetes bacterium]|nr:Gfo/Idh/MocA family oxidoreductase [Planctomycetota bacterium]
MKLHVGLIGTGGWAQVHLSALQESPYVERVTLCGRNAARLVELAATSSKVVATVPELDQLCNDPSIEVIDIVLPHDLHAPTALAALAAGKHVICEKPAGLSLAQFDEVAAAAERAGRRWLVVMNQLYNPRFEALQARVADGLVGRPFLLVENAYSNHTRWYHDPQSWRTRLSRAGGGVLIDGGYHMVYKHLELLRPFGLPRWVQGDAAQLNLTSSGAELADRGEDFVQFVVGYDGPLRIGASHSWSMPATAGRPWEGFLAGSQGVLDISAGIDGPVVLRSNAGEEAIPLPPILSQPRPDSMRLCLADYLAAMAEDRPPRWGGVAAARATLAVVLAVYESARTGVRIPLTP